jgi:hypothetical protein
MCERTCATLITNPCAPRIWPYLYFHGRFIEPFCASTFCMYMYYRVSTFQELRRIKLRIVMRVKWLWFIDRTSSIRCPERWRKSGLLCNIIVCKTVSKLGTSCIHGSFQKKLDFLFDLWRKYQSGRKRVQLWGENGHFFRRKCPMKRRKCCVPIVCTSCRNSPLFYWRYPPTMY